MMANASLGKSLLHKTSETMFFDQKRWRHLPIRQNHYKVMFRKESSCCTGPVKALTSAGTFRRL